MRQATIQGRHLFVIASQSGLVATARKALYQPLAVTLRLGPRPLQQAADARLLEQRRNRRNAAIGSFTQAGHLQLQITGKTAQFIGEHAETERRLPGALGKKNRVHCHKIDLEGRRYDALDLFVDAHDAAQLAAGEWRQDSTAVRGINESLAQLAARYLTAAKAARGEGRQPLDAVARFHLGNGARIERINPGGDSSAKGLQQSFGVMVNYLYDLDELEQNVESFAREGAIATSAAVRRLARPKQVQ